MNELTKEFTDSINSLCAAIETNRNVRPFVTDLVTLILEQAKSDAINETEDRMAGHLIASHSPVVPKSPKVFTSRGPRGRYMGRSNPNGNKK